MNFIDRSIEIAKGLFPSVYNYRNGYRTYHFSFAWRKNNLLSIGINRPDKQFAKALFFNRKFKINNFGFIHAELDMLSKLFGRFYIDNSLKVVIIRLNRSGILMNSKPCKNCATVLNALNVNRIWYSKDNTIYEN